MSKTSLWVGVAVMAGAVVGCSDVTAPEIGVEESASYSKGVSNPNTAVAAGFTITTGSEGGTLVLLSQPKNAGQTSNDYCDSEGALWKQHPQTGAWTKQNAVPHAQCYEIVYNGTTTVTVTFESAANYVLATNGNVQLNFKGEPQYNEVGECVMNCTSRFVHYQKQQNTTRGSGLITGFGSDGSVWTIDLSQINHIGNAQILALDIGPLVATSGANSYGLAQLTWVPAR